MPVTQNKDDGSDEDGVQYVLDIREVDIAWKDLDNVYIRSGLENSEYVITSVIPTAIQGMPLTISNIVKNS